MSYEPFLIAPYTSGLDTDLAPWLLPKDAFQSILNGYIHHGVLYKRNGIQFFANTAHSGGVTPELPVMGIKSFVDTDGTKQFLAFDTRRACLLNQSTQTFDALDVADIFGGDESSFINAAAFGRTNAFATPTLFFTNFNGDTSIAVNPIRTFVTNAIPAPFVTTQFAPDTTPTAGSRNYVLAAQFIFSIRQRLVLLNTVEGSAAPAGTPPSGSGTNYAQRARWSRAQNPSEGTGPSDYPWDQITPGNGGFVDAPTSDKITGATQLQDIIIVHFTNSVWALKPTSDPALPFRWEKINNFRACDAPYANIGHDRYVISFGIRGIVATDSVEVQRIDQKIDKFIVENVNLDFVNRMYSERNYTDRRSWTLYPSSLDDPDDSGDEEETSNKALIRTEEEGAWSVYTVSVVDDNGDSVNMSCLGFGQSSTDLAWEDFDGSQPLAPDYAWEDFSEENWSSFFSQANEELFWGGDQIGRILSLEIDGDDLGEPISFDVVSAAWNPYKEKGAAAQLGYVDFYLEADTDTQFTVEFYVDDITTPYATQSLDCLPDLGFIADIQDITLNNPVEVTADSHGLTTGDEIYIYNLNGAGNLTGGPYTVTVVDENNITLDGVDGTGFEAYESGGTIVEREFANTKCWKRAYAGGKGYQHYIRIKNTGKDDLLQFNAFMPWFRRSGTRMIG
jgi:hypothetical protein